MFALTVWQPWATLIALGAKPYEFRSWPAPRNVRGARIAIHAAVRAVKRDEVADLILRLQGDSPWTAGLHKERALGVLERALLRPFALPRSLIICTAVLGQPVRASTVAEEFGAPSHDDGAHPPMPDVWAWPLADVRPCNFVEARGQQGFWGCGQTELFDTPPARRTIEKGDVC